TSATVPWSFRLRNSATAVSSARQGELMRITGDIEADANTEAHLANSSITFGQSFGIIRTALPFMHRLPFPAPLGVSMTNDIKLKVALNIPIDDELNPRMPPCGPHFEDADATVGTEIDSPNSEIEFEAGGTIFLPTPFSTCVEGKLQGFQAVGLF